MRSDRKHRNSDAKCCEQGLVWTPTIRHQGSGYPLESPNMLRFLKEEQDDLSPCSYDGQHSIKAESCFMMVGCTETVCKETAVPSMEALNKKAQFDTAGDQSTSVTETKLERLVWVKTEPSVSLEPSSTELKMIENHQSSLTNIKTEQLGDESQEAQSCNTQGQVKVEQAEIFRKQDLVTYQVTVRFDGEEDKGKAIICKQDNRDDVFVLQKSYLFDQDREPDSDSTLGYAESSTDTDNGGVTECDRGAESSYTSTDTKRRMSDQNDSGHDDSKGKRESEDLTSRSDNVKNCLNLKSAEKTNTAASKVVQRRKKKIKTRGKSITSAVEGRFPCPHCDRSYTTTQGLRRHSYSHAAEKPFSCDKCGKRLGSRESLRDHMNTHTGDKRFQCRECSTNFATRKYLEKHEFLHTGLRPFKCDTCEQSFSRKGNLQRHRLTHESQKSIMCLLCDKLFYSKGSLDMHTSNIHSEKKSYECSDCGRHFAVKSRLTAHMTKHTLPFQCTVCDNRFSTKVGLQNHVHRVNPCWSDSVCEICGERFRRPKQLQEHKKKFHDY